VSQHIDAGLDHSLQTRPVLRVANTGLPCAWATSTAALAMAPSIFTTGLVAHIDAGKKLDTVQTLFKISPRHLRGFV